MRAIALRLVVIWGWRRAALCLVLGAASALSMEPYSLLPVLFVTVPPLVWMLDGVDAQTESRFQAFRGGAMVGTVFAFAYFLAGLHWVGSAFLVDSDAHGAVMWPVMFFFPLLLALFWGLGCGLAAALWKTGPARIALLAVCLAGAEWLRGTVLSGFPWNTPGLAVAGSAELSQIAAFVGVSGLNLIVVLMAGAPAVLADEPARRSFGAYGNWLAVGLVLAGLAGLWGVGRYQLSQTLPEGAETTRVRILQPNIAQTEKWDPVHRSRIFSSYLELSDIATSPEVTGIEDVDLLIWPESAPPFLLERNSDAMASIAAMLPDDSVLLTGALHAEDVSGAAPGARKRIYNSVLAIDGRGTVLDRYDKVHLVPFGEYLPFEDRLAELGIHKLVQLPGSFEAGTEPRTISITGIPTFSPLICYEVIFARAVAAPADRPAWLLNVTNDAWFGDSAGPRQHLQQARFRAIEQGLPVMRSANTGISAVIDARGRIVKFLPVGVSGVIDAVLPPAAAPPFYAVYGDWILLVLMIGTLICAAVPVRRKPRASRYDPHKDFLET